MTPLIAAVGESKADAVKALLSLGADASIKGTPIETRNFNNKK
jgi:hypothetical protein